MKYKLLSINPSHRKDKKYMAIFHDTQKDDYITTHFGAKGMSDYTIHKDIERKKRYIDRHQKNENWSDPTTPGALSRWILWNLPTLKDSIKDFKKRFNL